MTLSTGMVLAALILCVGSFALLLLCMWLVSRARRNK